MEVIDQSFLRISEREGSGEFSGLKRITKPYHDFFGMFRCLISGARLFGYIIQTMVHRLEVCEDEFIVDHIDIPFRIDRPTHMMNIRILKITYHFEDGIDLPDMGEKFVPESFSRTRSRDESSDIDEFYSGWDGFPAPKNFLEFLESRIIHIYDTDIRLDSTEWEILRCCCIRSSQCIEESRFPYVRESDDSDFHRTLINKKYFFFFYYLTTGNPSIKEYHETTQENNDRDTCHEYTSCRFYMRVCIVEWSDIAEGESEKYDVENNTDEEDTEEYEIHTWNIASFSRKARVGCFSLA